MVNPSEDDRDKTHRILLKIGILQQAACILQSLNIHRILTKKLKKLYGLPQRPKTSLSANVDYLSSTSPSTYPCITTDVNSFPLCGSGCLGNNAAVVVSRTWSTTQSVQVSEEVIQRWVYCVSVTPRWVTTMWLNTQWTEKNPLTAFVLARVVWKASRLTKPRSSYRYRRKTSKSMLCLMLLAMSLRLRSLLWLSVQMWSFVQVMGPQQHAGPCVRNYSQMVTYQYSDAWLHYVTQQRCSNWFCRHTWNPLSSLRVSQK